MEATKWRAVYIPWIVGRGLLTKDVEAIYLPIVIYIYHALLVLIVFDSVIEGNINYRLLC